MSDDKPTPIDPAQDRLNQLYGPYIGQRVGRLIESSTAGSVPRDTTEPATKDAGESEPEKTD